MRWGQFHIGELFEVKRPVARNKDDYFDGSIPFVASGSSNNGVMKCCKPKPGEKLDESGCITVSPVDGSAFYQPTDFLGRGGAGSSVLMLYGDENINNMNGLFIAQMISQTCSKYSYGHMGNKDGIKREVVQLPINNQKKPDYEYMANYIINNYNHLLNKYFKYVNKSVRIIEYKSIPQLSEKEWKATPICSMFHLIRGRENNMAMLTNGKTPLVSAKRINNGLKGFVSTPNRTIKGNCISLNNDGDGGAGLAFYQPYEMALDTHVTALIPKEKISKWSMLFISECISKLHGFFGHGLSISNKRAEKIQIMLPVTDVGQPDFEYMEQYAKNMMLKKYKQYLSYLEHKKK